MSAVLIGFLIVVASAALFGLALFGRRPLPQPATQPAVSTRVSSAPAETPPSAASRRPISTEPPTTTGPPESHRWKSSDVGIPLTRRARSVVLLAISVVGAALLIGAVLSIVVVGAVLLVA